MTQGTPPPDVENEAQLLDNLVGKLVFERQGIGEQLAEIVRKSDPAKDALNPDLRVVVGVCLGRQFHAHVDEGEQPYADARPAGPSLRREIQIFKLALHPDSHDEIQEHVADFTRHIRQNLDGRRFDLFLSFHYTRGLVVRDAETGQDVTRRDEFGTTSWPGSTQVTLDFETGPETIYVTAETASGWYGVTSIPIVRAPGGPGGVVVKPGFIPNLTAVAREDATVGRGYFRVFEPAQSGAPEQPAADKDGAKDAVATGHPT